VGRLITTQVNPISARPAKASRRRVAERAQGWMPMIAPAGVGDALFKTVRTPPPGSPEDTKGQIAQIRQDAAPRGVALDFVMVYLDGTISDPRREADRHREAFAGLAEIGFTWIVINRPTAGRSEMLEFLAAFGETYLSA